jgi:hypothetical protein
MQTKHRNLFIALLVLFGISMSAWATASENAGPEPLTIQEQGSFAVGGTVVTNPGTFDPVKMSPEGQPFTEITLMCFTRFRRRPVNFPSCSGTATGSSRRRGKPRRMGARAIKIFSSAAALFNKIGPGVLVTHSHSGGPGWRTAIKSQNVRAIVAYEPGSNFIFPGGEVPPPMSSSGGPLEGVGVPLSDFMLLTKIPIVIYYGDNIPDEPIANPGQDQWRIRLAMARLWADAVNRRGGDVSVVHLPEVGIRGNTHFPLSDLNNLDVADLMSEFLKKKGLD